MTISKFIVAAAITATATVAYTAPANAQTAGIATAEPTVAVWRSKAYAAASQSIDTTYKSAYEQIGAKRTEQQKFLLQLDKNNDKNVDQSEMEAARAAKNPALTQYEALLKEENTLKVPIVRSEAFAVEMILKRYAEAQEAVVKAKKIAVILSPESFVYAPKGTDVTEDITTELDKVLPSVPITAPDNWRPTEETMAVVQRLQQYTVAAVQQVRAQQAAAGAKPGAQAPAATGTPAPAKPKPQGR